MRVILADDSVLFREGMARLLAEAGFEVVGQAGDAEELLELIRIDPPDVVVVDIRMPPTHTDEGLRAAHDIRTRHPDVGVMVLSQYIDTGYAMELMVQCADSLGYLLKDRVSDLAEFADAVKRVATGGSAIDPEVISRLLARQREKDPLEALTERERDVLALMAQGRSNQAICDRLFLSLKTVEAHVHSIFTKLDLIPAVDDHRRVLAVIRFLRS